MFGRLTDASMTLRDPVARARYEQAFSPRRQPAKAATPAPSGPATPEPAPPQASPRPAEPEAPAPLGRGQRRRLRPRSGAAQGREVLGADSAHRTRGVARAGRPAGTVAAPAGPGVPEEPHVEAAHGGRPQAGAGRAPHERPCASSCWPRSTPRASSPNAPAPCTARSSSSTRKTRKPCRASRPSILREAPPGGSEGSSPDPDPGRVRLSGQGLDPDAPVFHLAAVALDADGARGGAPRARPRAARRCRWPAATPPRTVTTSSFQSCGL